MPPAESNSGLLKRKVHPGADRRKCLSVFLYVRHTLRVWSGKGELPFSIEWNHGYLRLYMGDGGFFVSLRMKEKRGSRAIMGVISYVKEEIAVIRERDPAIKSNMEVFLYPTFHAILKYRFAHKLYQRKHYFWARWISQRTARKTGIEIHPGATIGKGLFIDHGTGVVIGETAILGDNVTLYQGVTLGGTGKEQGKRHPTLEDNVMVSAGAKILGSFTIGENSKVGAGSVVLQPVPANCTVVGVPGRIVKKDNVRIPRTDLDQVDLPDPVLDAISELRQENNKLREELEILKQEIKGGNVQ